MNYSQDRNLPQGYFQKTPFKNAFTFASMPVTKAGEKRQQQNHFDFNIIYKSIPKPNKLKPLNMQFLYVNSSKVLSRMTRRLLLIVQTYLVIT